MNTENCGKPAQLLAVMDRRAEFGASPMQLAVVHPEAMKKMGIQQFQTILIESKSGRSTALMCFSNEDCPTDKIEIHKIARENLGVTLSDTVDVRGAIQDLIAKSIFVEVLQSRSSGDTVMPALKAYFEDATQRQLPFYEGDQFVTEDGLWLKIAKMTPPAFGSVTKSTRIELVSRRADPSINKGQITVQVDSVSGGSVINCHITNDQRVFPPPAAYTRPERLRARKGKHRSRKNNLEHPPCTYSGNFTGGPGDSSRDSYALLPT